MRREVLERAAGGPFADGEPVEIDHIGREPARDAYEEPRGIGGLVARGVLAAHDPVDRFGGVGLVPAPAFRLEHPDRIGQGVADRPRRTHIPDLHDPGIGHRPRRLRRQPPERRQPEHGRDKELPGIHGRGTLRGTGFV